MTRFLLMLRHADTEAARPGHRDIDRRLTERGLAQAAGVGRWLTEHYQVDAALCSPAVRTRETLAELGVGGHAGFPDWLYNAGGEEILSGIRTFDRGVRTALVVGHAPGVPAVVYDLTDPATSEPAAVASVESRYPAATLAVLRVQADWADLTRAALIDVRLPSE